jgi:hypothetical protein
MACHLIFEPSRSAIAPNIQTNVPAKTNAMDLPRRSAGMPRLLDNIDFRKNLLVLDFFESNFTRNNAYMTGRHSCSERPLYPESA